MPRAPFNVLIYPYRRLSSGEFVYAILKRSEGGYWQAVAGGGEDDETPLEAARRETFEEVDIPKDSRFLRLDTVISVPVTAFADSYLWGEDVYVIPQYCFGVQVADNRIVLSDEHTEYRWLAVEEASNLLRYDNNRTALWELDRRIRGIGPRD